MNRLLEFGQNPQQAILGRRGIANGLFTGKSAKGANLQPDPQRVSCGGFDIGCRSLNSNSPRESPVLVLVSSSKSSALSVNQVGSRSSPEWTEEMQSRLDALIQKEALGGISESETMQLEQLQIARDKIALGPELIRQMKEEQQALTELVNAFERYVRATRPR